MTLKYAAIRQKVQRGPIARVACVVWPVSLLMLQSRMHPTEVRHDVRAGGPERSCVSERLNQSVVSGT